MSKCELIELKDLSLSDGIELAAPAPCPAPPSPLISRLGRAPDRPGLGRAPDRPGLGRAPDRPGRSLVVRLVGDSVSMEAPSWWTREAGKGHDFHPASYAQMTWCDLCGDFIWGLYKPSFRCANCGYTCHYRCVPLIQLDCSTYTYPLTPQADVTEDTIETDTNVDEQIDWGKQDLSVSEIQQKVMEYNAQISNNLHMVLNKDGSYTGFIKVQFKLVRPMTIAAPQKLSVPREGEPQYGGLKQQNSFYLPRNTAKHLHISSHTRTQEVIVALLNKFTVVDNPAKFALFERSEQQNQVSLRRLSDDECPLRLRLCAGPSEGVLALVLKENETGGVNWDAFSLPELCNFLRILRREEEEHVRQIVRRYAGAREKMRSAVARATLGPERR